MDLVGSPNRSLRANRRFPRRSVLAFGVAREFPAERKWIHPATAYTKAMSIELPPVIAAFFHATNTREFSDFLSLFTLNAHVNDEANDYYGAEIAAWIDRATADTKPTADVAGITGEGGQFVITAGVSGNFPGSPVQLRYYFTLKDGKIATLLIKA